MKQDKDKDKDESEASLLAELNLAGKLAQTK